ncbi:MAG: hypothetical protein H7222_08405 [Methylotenera sp.]|nr:hypothetical protein [Oligoflexia bacterium]
MKLIQNTLLVSLISSLSVLLIPSAQAAGPSMVTTTVVPIIGFERTQKLVPTPHATTRLIYGVRVTAGVRLLSLESEYTHGMDSEAFPLQNLTTRDTADRVKLGIRSTFAMSSFLSTFLRAGGQATRNVHEETNSGVSTKTTDKIKYSPYAGTGLDIRLFHNFSLTAGLTVVFNQFPDLKKNDYQTTAGFTIRFP